jgi:hypothetical protein
LKFLGTGLSGDLKNLNFSKYGGTNFFYRGCYFYIEKLNECYLAVCSKTPMAHELVALSSQEIKEFIKNFAAYK